MNEFQLSPGFGLATLLTLMPANAHAQSASPDLGRSNQVVITQIGEVQRAAIDQQNIHGGLLYGAIQQNGLGNDASISLEGGDLSGSITQNGNNNQATLEIRDEHNRGMIEQYGDGNSVGLQIQGYGKDITVIQEGNGHSFSSPIKVGGDTPGGLPITIRQY